MNQDIQKLLSELSDEEKLELKKFRMEYLKKLMIDKLTQATSMEIDPPTHTSISTTKTDKESFEKVFLYIPKKFKSKIVDLKTTGKPLTETLRNKIDNFFKFNNQDFKEILDTYKNYYKNHVDKNRENLCCSVENIKIHSINELSKEFQLPKRWIIEAILYNQTNNLSQR